MGRQNNKTVVIVRNTVELKKIKEREGIYHKREYRRQDSRRRETELNE